MIRFYKKMSPRQQLVLSNGSLAQFDFVDQATGILKTDNEWLQREFATLTSQGRGGIDEINEAEYNQLAEKKKRAEGSPSPWRQELGNLFRVLETPVALEASKEAASPAATEKPGSAAGRIVDAQLLRPSASRPMKAAGGSGMTR